MSHQQINQLHQKAPLIFPTQKNVQNNLLEIKTSSQHSTVLSISSNQEHSKEPIGDRKLKKNRPHAPTTTIIGDSMIKKVFGDNSTINSML